MRNKPLWIPVKELFQEAQCITKKTVEELIDYFTPVEYVRSSLLNFLKYLSR